MPAAPPCCAPAWRRAAGRWLDVPVLYAGAFDESRAARNAMARTRTELTAPTQRDPAFARYPAILPDGALALPLSGRPGGAEGFHAPGGRARRRAQRPAHPWRLPPQPVDRLPAGLRALPRLRVGARAGQRVQALAQHAPHRRAQHRPDRRHARADADLRAVFGVPRLSRRPPPQRRHGRHDRARLRHDDRGQPCRHAAGRVPPARAGQPASTAAAPGNCWRWR